MNFLWVMMQRLVFMRLQEIFFRKFSSYRPLELVVQGLGRLIEMDAS